jgi:hypothetical protein
MRYLFLFLLLSFSLICNSQTTKSNDQYLQINFSQIKEALNYGFVFNGSQIQYGRDWLWKKPDKRFELESQLGLTSVFNKGIGLDFHLTPFNFNYLFKVNDQLWMGPTVLTDYDYDFYPDLQMGHPFWFSHYSAGASLYFKKQFQKRLMTVKFSSSLLGFTSRTPEDFNTLFFYLGFFRALKDLHSDLSCGILSQYNVSHFEFSLTPVQAHRVSFSYTIDYIGYYKSPRWTRLNYGVKLTIKPKRI